ncbi:MAG: hypothetical protein VYA99_08760, partial [Pseudomonadota bacterium]|nr:hypothetical protein [Pseudomonadota bacterium]
MNQLLPLLGLILIISTTPLSSAQNIDYPDSFNEPMALFDEAMGDFHFPISSSSELAQAYF